VPLSLCHLYIDRKYTEIIYVWQEKPQLENQRSELLESIASDLQFLRDLEDKSLSLLQKTEGAYDYEYVLMQICCWIDMTMLFYLILARNLLMITCPMILILTTIKSIFVCKQKPQG
jgi:hypothetical protein